MGPQSGWLQMSPVVGTPWMVRRKEGQQVLTGLKGTAQLGSPFRATEHE